MRWPPPADILLNYDVVPPAEGAVVGVGGVLRSTDVDQHTYGGVRTVLVTSPETKESQMAVGDKSAQSYGWSVKTAEEVADGGELSVAAPGFDHRYTDVEHADISIASHTGVIRNGKGVDVAVVATSQDDPVSLTLTNHTGVAWPPGDEIYVFCPHLLAAGANEWDLKEQVWDLQQRVKKLEDETEVTMEAVEPEESHAKGKNHKKGK